MSEESHPSALLIAIKNQSELIRSIDSKVSDIARSIPAISDRVLKLEHDNVTQWEVLKKDVLPSQEETKRRLNQMFGGIAVMSVIGALILTMLLALFRQYTKFEYESEWSKTHPSKESK